MVEIASSSRTRKAHLGMSKSAIVAAVVALDAALVFLSGLVIFLLYVDETSRVNSMYFVAFVTATIIVVHGLHTAGQYRFNIIIRPRQQLSVLVATCTIAILALVAVAYGLKISDEFSRLWAASWWFAMIVLLVLGRQIVAGALPELARRGMLTRRIAIYGSGEYATIFIDRLKQLDEPWNEVIGVFDDRDAEPEHSRTSLPVRGSLEDLIVTGREENVEEVIIALPWTESSDRIDSVLSKLSVLTANIRLGIAPSFLHYMSTRINTQFGIPVASIMERPISGVQAWEKRIFDLTLSLLLLVLTIPIMLLIMLAIKIDSRGPIFFRQQRYGFSDQLIWVWKFRTMRQDAADKQAERLATRDDRRVTRVGRYLRSWSLDELPQLFNIINGQMSLVGPRPHATKAKAGGKLYQDVVHHYSSRHRVKPGLTGWAQVNGWRGETDTPEKIINRVKHDLYYISNWSLGFDMKIILLTIKAVLTKENAY